MRRGSRRRAWRAAVAAAALCWALGAGPAAAERVLVRAPAGQEGHAWLFGARDGTCWLATPLHVIADPTSGRPQPFVFQDRTGKGGESGPPVAVADLPGGLAATAGVPDLAFAPVASGRGAGACLSRLGLHALAYDAVLRRLPALTLLSLLPTSFGVIEAQVARARSDAAGGGLIEIRPAREADFAPYFRQGLSGSVAEVARGAETVPFAMVLEVDPARASARALRFDLIRAAFDLAEAHAAGRTVQEGAAAAAWRVLGFEAVAEETGAGPSRLAEPGACWRISAPDGARVATLVIAIDGQDAGIAGVSVVQPPDCGNEPPVRVFVDQRAGGDGSWARAASCTTVAAAGEGPACRLNVRGPRQVRLLIEARAPVGLGAIRVY